MQRGNGVGQHVGPRRTEPEKMDGRLIDRIGHYGRVSTDSQAERGTIEANRDYLQRQAEREGYAPVIEQWDAGWSGTIPFHERPGGRRIIDAAEAGRLDVLYVYAWDRLGRDAAEGIAVAKYLESLNVELISATQGRANTAAGRFQRNIHLVVAEYGRENILEVTRSGKLRAAREGKWCGRVPYGWTVKDDILVHRVVEVLPGMTEADVMRDILVRLADTETSLVAEARRLKIRPTPKCGPQSRRSSPIPARFWSGHGQRTRSSIWVMPGTPKTRNDGGSWRHSARRIASDGTPSNWPGGASRPSTWPRRRSRPSWPRWRPYSSKSTGLERMTSSRGSSGNGSQRSSRWPRKPGPA